MTERPILFSGPMVCASREGRKTQTRRIVKPGMWLDLVQAVIKANGHWVWDTLEGELTTPYGQPGDRLYVKEAAWLWCERRPNGVTKTGRPKWRYVPMRAAGVWYAADHRTKPTISVVSPDTGNEWGWRLKIGRFLPRWASRITLEITEVRVERLQEINRGDAMEEGCPFANMQKGPDPRDWFRALWESLHGPDSWSANPLVWVVEFRRVTP